MGALLLLSGSGVAATLRASQLAMGTVVGLTVVVDDPADAEPGFTAAWAAIEAGEALLSEWRPDSLTSRMGRGERVALPPDALALFTFAEGLRVASDGHFDVGWRSGARLDPTGAATGPLDLGGVLKGWLCDRAGAALLAAGVEDFLVDAAGDVLAHGDAEGGRGWRVDVVGAGRVRARVRLHDEALSTSGNDGQPGHVHDARSGAAIEGDRVVAIVAPTGLLADGLATAIYAGASPRIARAHGARVVPTRPP